ncbi:hypothetical protein [Sphingomonas abietis]|uniref:Uncharacterized protein n=1 Tax=Sphingomonas abietis TaxID=3012344 RepID=A0ABY7NWJ2_9SPHN|nr:hypothetical protein [Sphingomonas abietis]WBO24269.1 hypothetical protein PBT88_09290 [Sphingomonas abietis]
MNKLSPTVVAASIAVTAVTSPVVAAPASRIVMHKVQLYNFDDASVAVTDLDGTLIPSRPNGIVDLNDVGSYTIRIKSGDVTISAKTMAILMNRYILPRAESPLSDLAMSFGSGVIHMHGKIRALGLKLGFAADAYPFVTPDGDMGMRVEHLKTAGFIPSSFSNALGMTLERMAQPGKPGVMTVKGNVMAVSVGATFPPPALDGKLSAVRVTPVGMTTRIGSGKSGTGAPFITIEGGAVKFAHLLMPEAKLVIRPMKAEADFGFSPRRYYRQMVEGTSKATPDFGLIGFFGDFRQLRR